MAERDKDRRIIKRKSFSEKITFSTLYKADQKSQDDKNATCLDISDGGLCFETTDQLHAKQMIRMMLPVKEVNVSSPILGEVVWALPANGKFKVGVRFII